MNLRDFHGGVKILKEFIFSKVLGLEPVNTHSNWVKIHSQTFSKESSLSRNNSKKSQNTGMKQKIDWV